MMNKNEPLTPERVNQILGQFKRQQSQVEGEITTMRADTNASLFQNLVGMFNQILQEKTNTEQALTEAKARLEEIYRGHPDIKISMDSKDAPKKPAPTPKGK